MPPRKKVIGYDQQTGQAIYEEALPSPMQDDPMAPLPAVDTVPLDDMDTMNGVSADPYADAPVPQDVVADVASMEIPKTGMAFDFGALNVQTKEDFEALEPEVKQLLRAMKYNKVQFTPQSAAEFILNQTKARMETDQKIRLRQSDPAVAASVQRNTAATEAQKKASAQKQQAALDTIGSMRGTINDLTSHPGFSGSVGAKNASYLFGLKGDPVAGTKEADFKAMLEQVQGGAFLQAFESLKGGGQITQVEGEKATQAIVRAQQSQSEEGFKKSMNDFLSVLDKAEKRATSGEIVQQPSTPAATAAAPRQTKTISGIVWEKGDDGKWYRKR